MSSAAPPVLGERAPSKYITVAGTELPLPPNARVDLAYQWEYDPTPVSNTVGFDITVGGDYFEIPLSFRATFTTDNVTSGSRAVRFAIRDQNGIIVAATLPPAVQAMNTTFIYFGLFGLSYPPAPILTEMQMPIPTVVAQPGWEHLLSAFGSNGTNDAFTVETFTVLRIPTGPPEPTATPSVATPLLA